jgi:acetolactate synthase-1/2/3 large subunit/5-guanidino-2-oxopentanoate decarboxylase
MRPLGAEISHALKARGVDVIFGIPGVHNIELYRGIEQAGIRHVLTRHEQGAGFMADGYARATGKPGVAYVITGPGLCNIMTPMGQAYSDSVPMLVVSSCLERTHRSMARGRLHEMRDQEAAAATVCDWSRTAPDAEAAFHLLDLAFAEFASQRQRPKHIQVPIDVLAGSAPAAPGPMAAPSLPIAAPDQVARVAALLQAAKRPLFVFGGGAAADADAARMVLAQTGAACFLTYAGRGVIPSSAPLNFGSTLGRTGSKRAIASADLIVAIGTHLAEVDLWRDHLGHQAPMVRVDIDAAVLADWHKAEVPVLGDAGAFLADLAKALPETPAKTTWKATDIAEARAAFRAETEAERPGIVPVVDALRQALPVETVVYSDMTQFAYVAKEVYDLDAPGLWHHPTGFGTLGYAMPAAIGGKVGLGMAPVVAIAGDYGFHYTMQELGVAVELGLNLPIILWDNGKLKEIEDSMLSAQIAPNAVVARNPDFCQLARAFGALADKPTDLPSFQAAVTAALAADRPTLIHVTPDILG